MMNLFVPAVLMAVLASVVLMAYAIAKRTADKSLFLIVLSIGTFLYTFGYLLEITSNTLEGAFYGLRVQYLALPLLLPLAYAFARDVCGKKRLSTAQLVLLLALPVINVVAAQIFPLVKIYYRDIEYVVYLGMANCKVYPGPLYYWGVAYGYVLFFLTARLMVKRLKHTEGQKRKQSIALLASLLLPLFSSLPYVFLPKLMPYDTAPLAVAFSMLLLLHAVKNENLLSVVPLAREQVIEDMKDAFVICDNELRFLDANRSAKELFPALSTLAQGESMEHLPNFKYEGELWLPRKGEIRFYKIDQTRVMEAGRHSGICIIFHDITEKERLLKKLHIQATFDPLMHIYNRATFFDMAELVLSTEQAQTMSYAVLMLDIDHFKPVNDTYGHLCGDTVLETIATVVKGHFRKGDIVGRYGGEEIVILLENLTCDQAVAAANKLRQLIAEAPIYCKERILRVTISIGVGHSPAGEAHSLERMVAQADAALYRAKNSGRNQVCI